MPGSCALLFLFPIQISDIKLEQLPIYLALAYITGLGIDAFAHYFIDKYVFSPICKKIKKPDIMDIWSGTLKITNSSGRRHMLKMIAERSLFRSLLLLSIFNLAYLAIAKNINWASWTVYAPILFAIPFWFFHWITNYNLEKIITNGQSDKNDISNHKEKSKADKKRKRSD